VIMAENVKPPLSLGLFGDWGTGKSFFMNKMRRRIDELEAESARAVAEGKPTAFCSNVVQIPFNAWHYIDDNLWASLVSRIFDGLCDEMADVPAKPVVDREELFKRLQSSQEFLAEATRKKASAEAVKAKAESHLDKVKEEREQAKKQIAEQQAQFEQAKINLAEVKEQHQQAKIDLAEVKEQHPQAKQDIFEVRPTDVLKSILGDEKTKEKLTGAAKELGLPAAQENIGELIEVARNLRSLGGRLWVFGQWLIAGPDRTRNIIVLIVLLVLPVLIVSGIDWLIASPQVQAVAKWLGLTVAALTEFLVWLKPWYAKAKQAMSKLNAARKEAENLAAEQQKAQAEELAKKQREQAEELAKKLKAHAEELAKKQKAQAEELAKRQQQVETLARQVDELRQEELAAQQAYELAEQEVAKLQEEISEIQAGRRLRKFIRERVDSSDYRKYAGIISLIRNDFEYLSGLLREASAEKRGPGLPRIDRIILYIDDLDRCPADRVVEVLQAVHLLLAFPLFVVIVGVDSRWMLQALKKHYAEILGYGGDESGFADGDMSSWTSTPHNYLEKIFQIPFTLRRMDAKGFEGLVQSLLPVRAQSTSQTHSGSSEPPPPPPGQAQQAAPPPPPQGQAPTPTPPPQPGQPPTPAPQQPQAQTPPPASRINMMPPNLAIEPWELEDIQKLSSMISSPRAAKRFVNIYRLIRASLKTRELAAFVGSKERRGEYQVVLILLSILTRFPNKASEIYVHLLKREATDWRLLLDGLKPQPTGTGYRNVVDAAIDNNELPIWRTVYVGLTRISELLDMHYPIERFAYWTPRVARFSFQSGRVIATFGTDAQSGQKTAAPA
jgi:KAP family P-loop domain